MWRFLGCVCAGSIVIMESRNACVFLHERGAHVLAGVGFTDFAASHEGLEK